MIVDRAPVWGQSQLHSARNQSLNTNRKPAGESNQGIAYHDVDRGVRDMVGLAALDESALDQAPGEPGVVVHLGRRLVFEGDVAKLDRQQGESFEAILTVDASNPGDFAYGYIHDSKNQETDIRARGFQTFNKHAGGQVESFGAESREYPTGAGSSLSFNNESWYVFS